MVCLSVKVGQKLKRVISTGIYQDSWSKIFGVSVLLFLLPVVSPAVTYTWDGNSPLLGLGNDRWRDGFNWVGDVAPPSASTSGLTNTDIVMAGTVKTSPRIDRVYYLHSLNFAAGAGAFTLDAQGQGELFLGSGGITNSSANLQTLDIDVTVSRSQTWFANAGNLAVSGLVNLGGNDLSVSGGFNTALTGAIQGTGDLIKNGGGTLTLGGTAANTFSGGLTVNAGAVTVAKASALGSGPLTMNGGVLNVGANNLTLGAVYLNGGTIAATSGGISSSAGYQLQAGTVSSALRGTGALIKTTPGTVVLNSANTYSGGTQVQGGKLVVNNATGSGTGSGNVSISSGGLVMGIGTIGGVVTNGPGGSISAGNEIGTLNLANTIWFGGATNRWDIANATGTAGVGYDLLNINGTLTLTATAADKAFIDITSFTLAGVRGLTSNFDPTQNYLWTVVQTSGGIIFAPGNNASTVFDLLTGNFQNSHAGGEFALSLSGDGRQLNLSYTYNAITVPEPGMLSLLGVGLVSLVYIKRIKRNWGPQR